MAKIEKLEVQGLTSIAQDSHDSLLFNVIDKLNEVIDAVEDGEPKKKAGRPKKKKE
jgi:hypothetical protein